ncbi:uncharacterized protein LOC136081274 [Hydra vulgaris]|uniref:Uncharacterized protein LOC136081274 n=1 Tax=Hydra vulgaris TaxID=6087 RepID=A0ABM4BZF3_HYDVU
MGQLIIFWLCYSKILDAAYCQPCCLIASQRNNVWCTGIRDWKHLSERIKQHSCSSGHSEACAVHEFWKENGTNTIDKELENEIRKQASFWKMILQRLFDIILTLAKSSLALRGYQEDLSQEGYYGNFLSFVVLVARYDHILRHVLDMPKGSTRYLNATIQNKMIESLGTKLETHLLEQIRASPFFVIILDSTKDKSKVDQLSIVVSVILDLEISVVDARLFVEKSAYEFKEKRIAQKKRMFDYEHMDEPIQSAETQ